MPVYSTLLHNCFARNSVDYIASQDHSDNLLNSRLIFTDFAMMHAFISGYGSRQGKGILMPQMYVLNKLVEQLQARTFLETPELKKRHPANTDIILLAVAVECCKSGTLSFTTALSYANFIWQQLQHMALLPTHSHTNALKKLINIWTEHHSLGMVYTAKTLLHILQSRPELNLDLLPQLLAKKIQQQIDEWIAAGQRVYFIGMPDSNINTRMILQALTNTQQDILMPNVGKFFDNKSGETIPMAAWVDYYAKLWQLFSLPQNEVCHLLAKKYPVDFVLSDIKWQSLRQDCVSHFSSDTEHDENKALTGAGDDRQGVQMTQTALQQIEYSHLQQEILGVASLIIRELRQAKKEQPDIQVLVPHEDYGKKLKYMLHSLDNINIEANNHLSMDQTPDGQVWLATAELIKSGSTPVAVLGFLRQVWVQTHVQADYRQEIKNYELKIRKYRFNIPFLYAQGMQTDDFSVWLNHLLKLINKAHAKYNLIRPQAPDRIFLLQLQILQWIAGSVAVEDDACLEEVIHRLPVMADCKKLLMFFYDLSKQDIKMRTEDWFVYMKLCCQNTHTSTADSFLINHTNPALAPGTQANIRIGTKLSHPIYKADVIFCAGMNLDSDYLSKTECAPLDSTACFFEQQRELLQLHTHKQYLINLSILLAKRIIMSRSKKDANDQHNPPHPFWVLIKNYGKKHHISLEIDDEFKRFLATASSTYQNYYDQGSTLNLLPKPCPDNMTRQCNISITDIKYLWRNPYVIFAKRILKLPTLLTLRTTPTYQDRGLCFHMIMEKFWRQKCEDLNLQTFSKIMDDSLRKWGQDPQVRFFWRHQFLKFGQWFVDNMVPWYKERVCDIWLEARGSVIDKTLPVKIKGIADVIYKLQDGSYGIIDYKTSSIPTRTSVKQGVEPQLSMEALMLQCGVFVSQQFSNTIKNHHVTKSLFENDSSSKLTVARLTYLGLSGQMQQRHKCVSFDLRTDDDLLHHTSVRIREFLQKFYLPRDIDRDNLEPFRAIDNGANKDHVENQYSQLMRLEG